MARVPIQRGVQLLFSAHHHHGKEQRETDRYK
jgi:hypothetical protein